MARGARLQIVRNPWGSITSVVFLLSADSIEKDIIHWWQINRLIDKRLLAYNANEPAASTELVLTNSVRKLAQMTNSARAGER